MPRTPVSRRPGAARPSKWLAGFALFTLACALPAIVVPGFSDLLSSWVRLVRMDRPAELSGQLLFIASLVLLLVSELAVAGYSAWVVRKGRVRTLASATLIWMGAIWIGVAWLLDFGRTLGGEYGWALVRGLWEYEVPGHAAPVVMRVATAVNGIGALEPALIGAALCAILHDCDTIDAAELARRTTRFRMLLLLSVALLISGTFFVFSLSRWSALSGATGRVEAALLLSSGITVSVGIFYSTLLFVGFVPTALLLMHAIDKLEGQALRRDGFPDPTSWRRIQRLEFAPLAEIRTYAAMLSPFLASLLQAYVLASLLDAYP